MTNTKKFWISASLTFFVSVGLIYWSYRARMHGTISVISPVAVIVFESLVLRVLAQAFRFGKQPKEQSGDSR